ncbi:hypothetical protein MSM1_09940 [Mycobacterium sp. SM1]|uniref:hypothetical protein n=1 Tax=Mycobacterium sp. SM1 TaxID=2816243 RepID=UPI001BCA9657|nr:hypothetical protein [Mycobacterium sp. SM1]MBS4728638.1 hypothetical protein [Mycobacterium sp. SM1]
MADRVEPFSVGMAVRVYPGTALEEPGTIIEDFSDLAGYGVDVGDKHISAPARRWAVALDTGGLVFADSDQLAAGLDGNP